MPDIPDIPRINRLTELGQKVIETKTVDGIVEIQFAKGGEGGEEPSGCCADVFEGSIPTIITVVFSGIYDCFPGEPYGPPPGTMQLHLSESEVCTWIGTIPDPSHPDWTCYYRAGDSGVDLYKYPISYFSGGNDPCSTHFVNGFDECHYVGLPGIAVHGIGGTADVLWGTFANGIIRPNGKIIQSYLNPKYAGFETQEDRFKHHYLLAIDKAKDSGKALVDESTFVKRRQGCIICPPEDKAGCLCVGCKQWPKLVFAEMKCPKNKW